MIEVPLTQGLFAIIDDEDFSIISKYKWCAHRRRSRSGFYAVTNIGGRKNHKTLQMHRLILGLSFADKRQGDHINGDSLDNRRINLRIATHAENQHNRRVSASAGVRFRKRWEAYITHNNKYLYLGTFDTSAEALSARIEAEKKYFGEFSPRRENIG